MACILLRTGLRSLRPRSASGVLPTCSIVNSLSIEGDEASFAGQHSWHAQPKWSSSALPGLGLPFLRVSASSAVAALKPAVYHVEVVTGDVRGAGTQTGAVVKLIGALGESEEFVVGDNGEDPGFERGSSRIYSLETGRHLGDLRRVYVQQMEPSITEVGSGWFLDRVDVTGPTGDKISFPCKTWLGKSDAGDFDGGMQRNLIPCQQVDTQKLIQEHYLSQPLQVRAGAVAWPHPDKVTQDKAKAVNRKGFGWAGEDAYFHAQCRRTGMFGLGVADGVYMWRDQGIDAGALARKLLSASQTAVDGGAVDVLSVLQTAAGKAEEDGCLGSSTCCIVLIDTYHGRLTSANVGDSGFVVLGRTPSQRDFHVKYRSPQQEHNFGVPYQLGHEQHADSPSDAMLMSFPVMPGDVIVLGSDGLWDNLAQDCVLESVRNCINRGARAPTMALDLARAAFEASTDKDAVTPYSLGATEAFDMVYSGGKKDDITVIAACLG